METFPLTDQPNRHTAHVVWRDEPGDYERVVELFPNAELVNSTLYIEGVYIPVGSRINRVVEGTKWWVE